MWRFKAVFIGKTQLTHDVHLLRFRLIWPALIDFTPGQYLILNIPKGNNFIKRLYSIASPCYKKDGFELLIKDVGGIGSSYLVNLSENEVVLFDGPAGAFCLKKDTNSVALLATGTGIAPVRSMLYEVSRLKKQFQSVVLYWGLPTIKDLFLCDELRYFEATINSFQFKIFFSQEESLNSTTNNLKKHVYLGRITMGLDDLLGHKNLFFNYYICGSKTTVDSIRQSLLERGVASTNLHYEKF